jgi:HAD superfamily hydrolase (TIGR01549 family)
MPAAALFDLDDTLLDTAGLRDARERREWGRVINSLGSVAPFEVGDGEPAIADLPKEAKNRGLAVGILTHSPREYADALIRHYKLRVDALVSGSDGFPTKPDPTGLLALARTLDVSPADCLYIGDAVGDFGAAAAAGMVSVGVSWAGKTPLTWRRGWPDIAVDRPSRMLEVFDGATNLGPLGEVLARRNEPQIHWGSFLRLGSSTIGLGRYFPMGDRRYPGDALSHLVVGSKDKPKERDRLATVFAAMDQVSVKNPPELIASVPPSPDGEDRFDSARQLLAEVFDAEDRGPLLKQRYGVNDYKFTARDERAAKVKDRFEATAGLDGERLLLIDDVINTGAQTEACRSALLEAGAKSVTILAASVSQDPLPKPCPECGEKFGGQVRTKTNRYTGQEFLGCSRYWRGCEWNESLPS